MNLNRRVVKLLLVAAVCLGLCLSVTSASAALTFFYDPDSGNVSFDTAETRSGGLFSYGLALNPNITGFTFNLENFIQVGSSALPSLNTEAKIEEVISLSQPVKGLYTIGNVLPSGLTQETWGDLFSKTLTSFVPGSFSGPGGHHYVDAVGEGSPDPAEFVFGSPGREFDNRWDLVDPSTLDWAEKATLVYYQATGEVVLDTQGSDGGYISAFHLESEDQFLPEGVAHSFDGVFNQAEPHLISVFADPIEPGEYSLGKILASGLSEEELDAAFSKITFLTLAGFGASSLEAEFFDFDSNGTAFALSFQAVPEPTTLSLLLMTCMLVMFVPPAARVQR